MTIRPESLDRYITGNYGENQHADPPPDCNHPRRLFVGDEPNDYDYPETGTHPVYVCDTCGDLVDPPPPDDPFEGIT